MQNWSAFASDWHRASMSSTKSNEVVMRLRAEILGLTIDSMLVDSDGLVLRAKQIIKERNEARDIATQLNRIHAHCLGTKSVHDYIRYDKDKETIESWSKPSCEDTRTRSARV